MISAALLAMLALVVAGLAGLNLYCCAFRDYANAYGHAIQRSNNAISFWVSAACSLLALAFGLGLAGLMVGGILGFFVD